MVRDVNGKEKKFLCSTQLGNLAHAWSRQTDKKFFFNTDTGFAAAEVGRLSDFESCVSSLPLKKIMLHLENFSFTMTIKGGPRSQVK